MPPPSPDTAGGCKSRRRDAARAALSDNDRVDVSQGATRMIQRSCRPSSLVLALAALTGLSGCAAPTAPGASPVAVAAKPAVPLPPAQVATAAPTPPARPAAVPAATPTPQPPGGGAPPFAVVVKDARRIDGPITAWQRDEKFWLELRPEQLGQPFLFMPKIKSGIGEGLLIGGLMTYAVGGAGGAQVVEFVRVHNTIRLQARNTDVVAKAGTPEARALASSYSASLLGAVPVASAPHPDRKSILVDAGSLFGGDVAGIGMQLQRMYRQGYSLDGRNSLITAVRGADNALVIETQTHFFTGSIGTLQPGSPLGAVAPSTPRYLPDARSLLIGQHLSLTPLPAQPMAPRRADPRVGYFTTTVLDFSDELARTPRKRMVHRWRLEKKDPAAAVSEPVRPITFWIDRNVPHAYRETVRGAILEWNKAFEKIGFRGAIVVQQQPDDAAFDTLDPGYASVRWLSSAEPGFGAIGQSQVDPRTGEILDADVAFEGMTLRAQRWARSQLLAGAAAQAQGADPVAALLSPLASLPTLVPQGHEACLHADVAAEQLSYALDVMQVKGDLDPGSPLAQQFVLDYIKDSVMHEIGHALGLRHNFRASRVYTEAQLSDPEFTRAHGTTGSVMEYNAINLARPGRVGGVPFQLTLGPYDYWAIEYAYKPAPPGASAADEEAELQRIASRSHEPLLAFGTDEDAFYGVDAETIQLDLGNDPIAFAAKRLEIARDLFSRQESRPLPPERDYSVLRRSLSYALGDATRAIAVLARQMGGLRTLRDYPGSGRDPIEPVPTHVQRQAFDLIVGAVLAADGFSVSPALQRRLAPDYLDRGELPGLPTDYNVPQRLLDLQRLVLAYLLSDQLAARLTDAAAKVDTGSDAFGPGEVYARLTNEVFGDLDKGTLVPLARREVQRDFVNRVATQLLRPSALVRADARSALRREARQLLGQIESALRRKGLDDATRAHWADSADTLREALAAKLPRLGV